MFELTFLPYVLIFILGLFVGSFLNLVSDRLEKGGSIWLGRSSCDFCNRKLAPKELVPLVSFFMQGGKCVNCKKKISLYYPASEILTASVFLAVSWWLKVFTSFDISRVIIFVVFIIISSILIVIFLSDLKYMIVPDKVVIPGIIFVLASQVLGSLFYSYSLYKNLNSSEFGNYLIKAGFLKSHVISYFSSVGGNVLTAFGVSLFFLFLIYITKGRGMGGGDVKLGFLIGLLNGFPNTFVSLFLSFLTGALCSFILVLIKKKRLKDAIPFGPFLIIGSFITLIFGSTIVDWYLKLL